MEYACTVAELPAAAYQPEGADPWHWLTSKGPALAVEAGRLHPTEYGRLTVVCVEECSKSSRY
jgi:hypothetical protein